MARDAEKTAAGARSSGGRRRPHLATANVTIATATRAVRIAARRRLTGLPVCRRSPQAEASPRGRWPRAPASLAPAAGFPRALPRHRMRHGPPRVSPCRTSLSPAAIVVALGARPRRSRPALLVRRSRDASRRRPARRSSSTASRSTTSTAARGLPSSTCTAPAAPSTTSSSRPGPGSPNATGWSPSTGPGYGYSGAPADGGRRAARPGAPAARRAAPTCDVERPVIVAHSAGVPTALALALEHPRRGRRDRDARRLLLLGARPRPRSSAACVACRSSGRFCARRSSSPWGRSSPASPSTASSIPTRPTRRSRASHRRSSSTRSDRRTPRATSRISRRGCASSAPRYAEIDLPVVAVHGLADYVVSAAQAVRFAQVVPQTELVLLEEVGHLPHFARPDAVVAAVERVWPGPTGAEPASSLPSIRTLHPPAWPGCPPEPPPCAAVAGRPVTFASPHPPAYTPPLVALGGEPAVPCTRNPLQRG